MVTEAQKRARDKYNKEHYKVITVNLRTEHLPEYEQYCSKYELTLAQSLIVLSQFGLRIKQAGFFEKLRLLFSGVKRS